jgi:putative membrane protein
MDDIVEDARREVEVLLTAWQTQGASNRGLFRPRAGDAPKSDASSEYYSDLLDPGEQNLV